MIPKIIHYCWLSGDPYPELISKCIASWKEKLPDYDFVLWDINKASECKSDWVDEAYRAKKYAFAADYVRFYALYHYGGIYLDADVEVLKSFNDLLNRSYFLGEEYGGDIEAAILGAEPGTQWVKECLDHYTNRHFVKEDGSYDMIPVPILLNKMRIIHNLSVFDYDYFSPKNLHIGKIESTNRTFCIHHFDGKWADKGTVFGLKNKIHRLLYFVFGRKGHNRIIRFIRRFLLNV